MQKRIFALLVTMFLAAASSTFSQPVAARGGHGNGSGDGSGGSFTPLSTDEIHDLYFMREEEKLARDSYWLLGAEWDMTIFENISISEQQHMDAMKKLLDYYELEDPVVDESVPEGFVDPQLQALFDFLMAWGHQSLADGLHVGAAIEETDILDIQHAIENADHANIISTYESLVCGSRNHLRAFVGQIELRGEVYIPIILSPAELEAIINTPIERDCGDTDDERSKGRN